MSSGLALGAAVLWGARRMPAIVLQVAGERVELAYRRRRQLRTGFTAIGKVALCEATVEHRRIAADVAPRLQLGLFE